MQLIQKQALEAFQRIQKFLAEIPVPPPGTYGEAKATLDDVVARLTDHSTVQVLEKRSEKANMSSEATLRRELREKHLRPISVIARGELRGSPGIDRAMTLPPDSMPTVKLVLEAKAMGAAAAPYSDKFVKLGRPTDFLEQLNALADRLQGIFDSKARNIGRRVGAREGLKDEISRGHRAVAILDSIVTATFASDAALLGRWRIARRVRGASGGRSAMPPNAPAAPQQATTASPATTTSHAA